VISQIAQLLSESIGNTRLLCLSMDIELEKIVVVDVMVLEGTAMGNDLLASWQVWQ